MEKNDHSKIAKPMLLMSGVAVFLMLLGISGFGTMLLDMTGHITPGTTLAEKMLNGTKGMDLMNNFAAIAFLAGVLASSYFYIRSRFGTKK